MAMVIFFCVLHSLDTITNGVGLSVMDDGGPTSAVSIGGCDRLACESRGKSQERSEAEDLHGVIDFCVLLEEVYAKARETGCVV